MAIPHSDIDTTIFLLQSLMEFVMGMRVKIVGDAIRPEDSCLIMMNHRTRLDWMYFWSCLVRHSQVQNEKIILKHPLKNIPGAGETLW